MGKSLSNCEIVEKFKKIHGDKYDYSEMGYTSTHNKIKIKCVKHGEFFQLAKNHLRGTKCPKCNIDLVTSNLNEFIKKAKLIHGNKYDYSKSKYTKCRNKTKIICLKHGEFFQTINNHLRGQGCPFCKKGKNSNRRNKLTINGFIERSQRVHGDKYDYHKVQYQSNSLKVKIICKKHGEFLQVPSSHMNGRGCPKCVSRISKPETEFLDLLNIHNEFRQFRILNFLVDGYDPTTKTIYEFNGDYWHGNPKKFKSNDVNERVNKTYGELYDFTFNHKFKKLKECGYTVKYIWESDWMSSKLKKLSTFNFL